MVWVERRVSRSWGAGLRGRREIGVVGVLEVREGGCF